MGDTLCSDWAILVSQCFSCDLWITAQLTVQKFSFLPPDGLTAGHVSDHIEFCIINIVEFVKIDRMNKALVDKIFSIHPMQWLSAKMRFKWKRFILLLQMSGKGAWGSTERRILYTQPTYYAPNQRTVCGLSIGLIPRAIECQGLYKGPIACMAVKLKPCAFLDCHHILRHGLLNEW